LSAVLLLSARLQYTAMPEDCIGGLQQALHPGYRSASYRCLVTLCSVLSRCYAYAQPATLCTRKH
jgi:hypothetical protein